MRIKPKLILFTTLIIAFKIISTQTIWIENIYVPYIFKPISVLLRTVSSIFPFSLGLVFVLLLAFYIVIQIVKKRYNVLFKTICVAYVYYMVTWGLLYYRLPLANYLNYNASSISEQELLELGKDLISKTNELRSQISNETLNQITFEETFKKAPKKFNTLTSEYPFLQYTISSIKQATFSPLLAYMGTSGIYTFWSGEANVNAINAHYAISNVTYHEMAHQLGYASEDEANYIAWLVGKNSNEKVDQYAAYNKAMFRTLNRIWYLDSTLAKGMYNQIDSLVLEDLEYQRNKWEPYENKVQENVVAPFYNFFLKANGKPQGSLTYDQVIDLIIFERRSLRLSEDSRSTKIF